jgi:hypothetical protein
MMGYDMSINSIAYFCNKNTLGSRGQVIDPRIICHLTFFNSNMAVFKKIIRKFVPVYDSI